MLVLLCVGSSFVAESALPSWETVPSTQVVGVAEPDQMEVAVRDGYIYVYTPQAVTVKVLSIVGQLISQQRLQPGVSRLKISARGIYILKVGDITQRVTI